MTRLRDDGYLETDCGVAASPFRGMAVVQNRADLVDFIPHVEGRLSAIRDNPEMPFEIFVAGENTIYEATSILIPAKTVAKRFNGGRVAGSDRQIWYMIEAILTADGLHVYLDPWLRAHTGEGE